MGLWVYGFVFEFAFKTSATGVRHGQTITEGRPMGAAEPLRIVNWVGAAGRVQMVVFELVLVFVFILWVCV